MSYIVSRLKCPKVTNLYDAGVSWIVWYMDTLMFFIHIS